MESEEEDMGSVMSTLLSTLSERDRIEVGCELCEVKEDQLEPRARPSGGDGLGRLTSRDSLRAAGAGQGRSATAAAPEVECRVRSGAPSATAPRARVVRRMRSERLHPNKSVLPPHLIHRCNRFTEGSR